MKHQQNKLEIFSNIIGGVVLGGAVIIMLFLAGCGTAENPPVKAPVPFGEFTYKDVNPMNVCSLAKKDRRKLLRGGYDVGSDEKPIWARGMKIEQSRILNTPAVGGWFKGEPRW